MRLMKMNEGIYDQVLKFVMSNFQMSQASDGCDVTPGHRGRGQCITSWMRVGPTRLT
jgi:hypothetical protein